MLLVCVSFCKQHYCRSDGQISLKLDVMIQSTSRKNRLTFGGDPVPDMDSGSVFHFPHHRGEDSLACSHTSPVDFKTLGEVTDADEAMNLQHFGSELADIWV